MIYTICGKKKHDEEEEEETKISICTCGECKPFLVGIGVVRQQTHIYISIRWRETSNICWWLYARKNMCAFFFTVFYRYVWMYYIFIPWQSCWISLEFWSPDPPEGINFFSLSLLHCQELVPVPKTPVFKLTLEFLYDEFRRISTFNGCFW